MLDNSLFIYPTRFCACPLAVHLPAKCEQGSEPE